MDKIASLGAFTGANLDVVNTLNREFDKRKEEISKLKEELDKAKKEHEAYVSNILRTFEDKYNELHMKNVSLQTEFHNENTANATFT